MEEEEGVSGERGAWSVGARGDFNYFSRFMSTPPYI